MNVMFIVPHADDEVLLGGGTISKHKRQGDHVTLCILMKPSSDREFKQLEDCKKVVNFLKIDKLDFLFIDDSKLSNDLVHLARTIDEYLENKKIDILYTISEFDNHQDHRNTFNAINIALRSVGKNNIKEVYSGETLSSTDQRFKNNGCFNPTVYNILTNKDIDNKVQAIKLYTLEYNDEPHPRSEKIIRALASLRGAECMTEFAEAFICLRKYIK